MQRSPTPHKAHLDIKIISELKSPIFSVENSSDIPRKEKLSENAREKNNTVSITEPIDDEISGAFHQRNFFKWVNILISINCATMNAVPEANAILGDEKYTDKMTAKKNPQYTTILALFGSYILFVISVIKNAIGYVKAAQVNKFSSPQILTGY